MTDISELWAKGITDAALCAVARNSMRHFVEADEHFKKQRFASALASAVFSIEETGKLYFLAFGGGPKIQTHRTKQMLFILLLTVLEGMGWWSHWRTMLKDGLPADTVLSEQQLKDIADHPEIAAFVEALGAGQLTDPKQRLDTFIQAVIKKEQRDGTADRWRPFWEGQLHKIRLQATYVDVSDTGEPVSDPSMITAESAEFLCAGALGLLTLSFSVMKSRLSGPMDEFKKLVVTDNLTGLDTVERVTQPILDAYRRAKEKEETGDIRT
jgi:hypothetical protein